MTFPLRISPAISHAEISAAQSALHPIAQLGHSRSQMLMEQMHALGWSVARNPDDANYWFARAVRWPFPAADSIGELQYFVGRDFMEGTGVKVDSAAAQSWWRLAAENGNEVAKARLGKQSSAR